MKVWIVGGYTPYHIDDNISAWSTKEQADEEAKFLQNQPGKEYEHYYVEEWEVDKPAS
jgi:hypothetical protein